MRRYKTGILAALLIEILLLSSCGSSATQGTVPELIEPVSANAAFRPVEPGTIGETQVLYGTVAPMEYCSFYDTTVEIEEIAVDVGDYVEKGDIVARADIDRAREELNDLNLQMENLKQNYELNDKISQLKMTQMSSAYDYKIRLLQNALSDNDASVPDSTADASGNEMREVSVSSNDAAKKEEQKSATIWNDLVLSGLLGDIMLWNDVSGSNAAGNDMSVFKDILNILQTEKQRELNVAQENLNYDEMLHGYRVAKLQEQIDSKQRIVTDSNLRAPHSGYVVYTKTLGISTTADAYENIVVLADPEETYIELTDTTILNYDYEDYEVKYLNLAGEKYDVTELPYSIETQILARASEKYPNVRLICPKAPKLTIGEMYPILYREKKALEVPVIGLDSLEGEEGAYFVYVKGENGEREKRFVTIGESDKYYVQILDGLAVGDLVYYESDALMPAEYREYTVELTDHKIDNVSRTYQLAEEQPVWYNAEGSGVITEFAVGVGDEVEAGDLLYVLMSDAGKAALADARNNINRENTTYEETIERLDKSLATESNGYAREVLILQKELETLNHAYRLRQLEETYNHMQENNDGNGEIRVYAKESGTVTRIPVREYVRVAENVQVSEGTKVLSIGREADDKLRVEMVEIKDSRGRIIETNYIDNIAEFGENVTITVDHYEYEGTCIGWAAHGSINLNKYYVSETEEGSKISFCTSSGYQNPSFYVEMEDESFYEDMPKGKVTFSYVSMEDVVLVPTALVKEEANAKNPVRKDNYVWRVVGDELVKQYVIVNKTYSNENFTLILSGVEEHDILAWEK